MVEVNNITSVQIDKKFVRGIIEKVLQGEKKEGKISVAFVGPRTIKKLNRNFRGKNRITDVLSFSEKEKKNDWLTVPSEKNFLGEMIICLKEVKKNSRKDGINFEDELKKVIIHGLLHILGYDHQKEGEAKVMEAKEKKYFIS